MYDNVCKHSFDLGCVVDFATQDVRFGALPTANGEADCSSFAVITPVVSAASKSCGICRNR
jgi:hypothetical protein